MVWQAKYGVDSGQLSRLEIETNIDDGARSWKRSMTPGLREKKRVPESL